ncbi:hypothetical protein B296_00018009 [Ensete ventricosum]|uniref:Uncharacterized protein n=1 Tax=Ensete ventricosum TaxID=4639 RepID=A0A426ZV74_ENSVE|nr:hypothetical protein B296_00018009 [Ensete ventricosum]
MAQFARRFTKGIEKLAGNTLGDCRKRTKRFVIRMSEAVGLMGFARRFTKGIEKLVGNTPGDCRKRTKRLVTRMSEAARLTGGLVFTQKRLVVDAGMSQGGGLGSGCRPVSVELL